MDNSTNKQLSLYQFEYKLIPQLINLTIENTSTVSEFVSFMANVDWIFNSVIAGENLHCDFDCNEVKSTVISPNKNTHVIVYTFPTPNEVPLAKYGAIVITSHMCGYFTLEKTYNMEDEEDAKWVLGETLSNGCHANFGEVNDCATPEDFATFILKRVPKKSPQKIIVFFKSIFKRLFSM